VELPWNINDFSILFMISIALTDIGNEVRRGHASIEEVYEKFRALCHTPDSPIHGLQIFYI
jgi:hypothetical protein